MKRYEACAAITTVVALLGMTACERGNGQPDYPPVTVPDSRPTAPAAQPAAAAANVPKPGPAYAIPPRVQDWPVLMWTQYGSGDQAQQAHFNYKYVDGQPVLGFYAAKTQRHDPEPKVAGYQTPPLYFGCKQSYLMQIENGAFTRLASGPQAPFCEPVKGSRDPEPLPSHAGLPDPRDLYGPVVFPIKTNIGSGD